MKPQGLIVKIRNAFILLDNPTRLITRVEYYTTIGVFTALSYMLMYFVLWMTLMFATTENCAIQCNKYFIELHSYDNNNIFLYAEQKLRNVIIAKNDQTREVKIYVSIPVKDKIDQPIKKPDDQKALTKNY